MIKRLAELNTIAVVRQNLERHFDIEPTKKPIGTYRVQVEVGFAKDDELVFAVRVTLSYKSTDSDTEELLVDGSVTVLGEYKLAQPFKDNDSLEKYAMELGELQLMSHVTIRLIGLLQDAKVRHIPSIPLDWKNGKGEIKKGTQSLAKEQKTNVTKPKLMIKKSPAKKINK